MKRIIAAIALAALTLVGCQAADEKPAPVQPADAGTAAKVPAAKKATASPIKIQAVKTRFRPSVLHSGGSFTSVKVTITNNTKSNLEINPLYFAITDSGGTKHDSSTGLGEDDQQIATIKLAPGEKATGSICAEGKFTPKTVSFTKDGFGDEARAAVA